MAIVEQGDNAETKKKRRSRRGGGIHKNIEEDKEEDGPRQVKAGVHADNEELGEEEEEANKEKGSRHRRSRRLIGNAIVNRWEDLETGEEGQDGGEEKRSRVRGKEAGEKKLRRRRKKTGEEENKKAAIKRYNEAPDEEVTRDAQLKGGGRITREIQRGEKESKEGKAEIDHDESKAEKDGEETAEEEEEEEVRKEKTEREGERDKKEEKGRVVELGQPAVEQLLVGKRLPQKVETLLPSIHRASKV